MTFKKTTRMGFARRMAGNGFRMAKSPALNDPKAATLVTAVTAMETWMVSEWLVSIPTKNELFEGVSKVF